MNSLLLICPSFTFILISGIIVFSEIVGQILTNLEKRQTCTWSRLQVLFSARVFKGWSQGETKTGENKMYFCMPKGWTEFRLKITGYEDQGLVLSEEVSKYLTSSTKFVFFGPIGKQTLPSDLWLADTFSTSPLQLLNRTSQNLTGSKYPTLWNAKLTYIQIFVPRYK